MSKVAFQRFKDPETEDFNDIEGIQEVYAEMRPIPIDNPFADTDLILFADDYTGQMPLNAIKESELNKAVHFYHNIIQNKGAFIVKGSDVFKNACFEGLRILMTRRLGRELLYSFDKYHPKTITFVETSLNNEYAHELNELQLNLGIIRPLTRGGLKGEIHAFPFPFYLNIGHELIHVLHEFEDPKQYRKNLNTPSEEQQFHNREEKLTITTHLKSASDFPNSEEKADLLSWDGLSQAEEITENSLRAVFSAYLRYGHQGLVALRPEPLDVNSKSAISYFCQCCLCGVMSEVEDLLSRGMDPNVIEVPPPLSDTLSILPIMAAAKGAHLNMVKFLISKGADPLKFCDGYGLTFWAAMSGNEKMLDYVLDQLHAPLQDLATSAFPLIFLSHVGDKYAAVLRKLDAHDLILHEPDSNGIHPLILLMKSGDIELTQKWLLQVKSKDELINIFQNAFKFNTFTWEATKVQSQMLSLLIDQAKKMGISSSEIAEQIRKIEFSFPSAINGTVPFCDLPEFAEFSNDFKIAFVQRWINMNFGRTYGLKFIYDDPKNIDLDICQDKDKSFKSLLSWAISNEDLGLMEYALKKGASTKSPVVQQLAKEKNNPNINKLLEDYH